MCIGVTTGRAPNALQTVFTSFFTFLLPPLSALTAQPHRSTLRTGTVKESSQNQQPAFSNFISENASCPECHNSELSRTETGSRAGKTKQDTAILMLLVTPVPVFHCRGKFQIFSLIQSVFQICLPQKILFLMSLLTSPWLWQITLCWQCFGWHGGGLLQG